MYKIETKNILTALQIGKELANKEAWKNAQVIASSVATVVSLGLVSLRSAGVDIPLSDQQVVVISGGIAAVLCIANAILTVATSSSVGIEK
jgi:hypothetical protein